MKRKSSSGNNIHPYVNEGIMLHGNDNWTTSKINREAPEYVTYKGDKFKIDGKITSIEIYTKRFVSKEIVYQKP